MPETRRSSDQHWLITGASGLLGHELVSALCDRGDVVTAVRSTHPVGIEGAREVQADITDREAIASIIAKARPDVVVHAAGLTNVDECERNPDKAQLIHVEGTRHVAEVTDGIGAKLVYISTDHLWDGTKSMVDEGVPPYPLNVYARTKLEGENVAASAAARTLIIRTNFFGNGRPWRKSLSDWILERLYAKTPLNMFTDAYFTPISIQHLIRHLLQLIGCDYAGLLHVAGAERISKFEFALALAEAAGLSKDPIRKASLGSYGVGAIRPRDMSLDTSRASALLGHRMPTIQEGIATLFRSKRDRSNDTIGRN